MTMQKLCAVTLAFCLTPVPSWARDCVAPRDEMALKAAGLQQELMVAALTCNDIKQYNRFVVSYRGQLKRSDRELQSYFHRAGKGSAGYHAYKTRLANQASLASLHDPLYCAKAQASFDDALGRQVRNLSRVVAHRAIPQSAGVEACEASTGSVYAHSTRHRRHNH